VSNVFKMGIKMNSFGIRRRARHARWASLGRWWSEGRPNQFPRLLSQHGTLGPSTGLVAICLIGVVIGVAVLDGGLLLMAKIQHDIGVGGRS